MPYSRSLRRPSSLIQSVVQAGDSTVRTFGCANAGALQRQLDLQRDHVHRRAAGIGRRDRDLDMAVADRDVAQHAEIGDGQHRNFGIDHLRRRVPGAPAQIGIAEQRRSPCRPRKRPLHRLQFAEEMAEMLAVPAAAAALLHPVVLRQRQRRFAARRRRPSSAIAHASVAGSIAMPASIRPRSLSSTSNISPV